jgi:hypothetical protein
MAVGKPIALICSRRWSGRQWRVTITQLTGLLGLIFGVVGTVLGILNYWCGRADVKVTLQWDMTVTPGGKYDASARAR